MSEQKRKYRHKTKPNEQNCVYVSVRLSLSRTTHCPNLGSRPGRNPPHSGVFTDPAEAPRLLVVFPGSFMPRPAVF